MSANLNSPFKIGMVYKTEDGKDIIIIGEANAGDPELHAVVGHDLIHRRTHESACGHCLGPRRENPNNLVPETGRLISELPQEFVWNSWLKKLFDGIEAICEVTGIDYVMSAHVPSETDPNRCFGYAGINDDAPDTMKKMLELMQSRPVIEDLLAPDSSCNTDSVNS